MIDSHAWIQSLKVGDEVIVRRNRNDDSLRVVSRITATQIVTGGTYEQRFKKSDGRLIGESRWDYVAIAPATDEAKAIVRERNDRIRFRRMVDKDATFSIQQIRAAIAALESQPSDRSSPE